MRQSHLPLLTPIHTHPDTHPGVITCYLHNDALPTATSFLTRLTDIHLALRGPGAKRPPTRPIGRHFLVVATDLTDKLVEGVFDIDAGFGGGFHELATELSGEGFSFCMELAGVKERRQTMGGHTLIGNSPLTLQITLIGHHNDGEVILILDT